jgi:hypothetical protein
VPLSLRILLPVALAAAAGAAMELVVPGVHDVITVALATVMYFGVLASLGQIPSELRGALLRGRSGG